MAGALELDEDAGGHRRFRLKAGTGRLIAASGASTTRVAANSGIWSVRRNAADTALVDRAE